MATLGSYSEKPLSESLALANPKRQQQAELAMEIWDQIFYHANANAKDPFHLSRHASHRLINRSLRATAGRRFFEELFLPHDYPQRMLRCMKLMAKTPRIAELVRDIHLELDFDRFAYNTLRIAITSLGNMTKLRILHLQISLYHESNLRAIWGQLHFPHLEQLSYVGGIDKQTHAFMLRHAPTLQLINLDGNESGQPSESGPIFPALYHAIRTGALFIKKSNECQILFLQKIRTFRRHRLDL
ncbi:hypothetical protein VNI00_018937 [Paramarasmius palmivorus]|uniref:Uncharacterized protein n=1 Tax=Paramarasmius palmivorus TaxID=297713 RepID=A0AAW0AT45_9AGAR